MRVVIAVLATVVLGTGLSACATDIPEATALVDGALTAPPAGWTSYCARHLEDSGCR
jgi:hypothetical protein